MRIDFRLRIFIQWNFDQFQIVIILLFLLFSNQRGFLKCILIWKNISLFIRILIFRIISWRCNLVQNLLIIILMKVITKWIEFEEISIAFSYSFINFFFLWIHNIWRWTSWQIDRIFKKIFIFLSETVLGLIL